MAARSGTLRQHSWAQALSALSALTLCVVLSNCHRRAAPDEKGAKPAGSAAKAANGAKDKPVHAALPGDSGPFFPSLARTLNGATIDVEYFADARACGTCHSEAEHEWQASAHAHASFDNPWYRASVDRLRGEIGNAPSRHCGGCHDPLLVFTGQMDVDVSADNRLATGGVTCLFCHSVVETRSDGNASYTLDPSPVPLPEPGDAESLARHRARVAPKALSTPALCATCHRGFLGRHTGIGHHLSGMDEPGAWRGSPWGGSRASTAEEVAPQACPDCHMRREPAKLKEPAARDGSIRSHRFPGGHTALAALVDDERQLEVVEQQLQSAVRVDVPAFWKNHELFVVGDPVSWQAGDELAVDVVVRNTGVGHNFPGGVKDMQDTWIELTLSDAAGRVLARAGSEQARREDPTAYVLRALVVDERGRPETKHIVTNFGTVAYDHTVPALGARTVRYQLTVPDGVSFPLRAEARLRHRRHRREARELACEATRSPRGRSFMKGRRQNALDGCAREPILDVASARVQLGGAEAGSGRPLSARLYDHALGLSVNLQERLDEARFSIDRALADLDANPTGDTRARGSLLTLLAKIAGRQGRLDEALKLADQAQALLGEHPAIDRVRGEAQAQVWHFAEAARWFSRVSDQSPGDTAGFRELARVRFSVNDACGALEAAQAGLKLQPRDEGLLRTQMLALERLNSPEAAGARKAYLLYREADETTSSRLACDHTLANCSRDRLPVVTIDLDGPRKPLAR